MLRIRPKFHKTITACRETPQSGPLGLPAPLSGALWTRSLAAPSGGGAPRPCCPLWGKCREAAKGVQLVILSCCHPSNSTPSVSLAGSEVPSSLPAPPSGSRGIVRIRPGFYETVSACRETPQSGPLGLPAPLSGALWTRSLAAPFGGGAPRSGKGGAVGDFELFPFNELHPLCDSLRAA